MEAAVAVLIQFIEPYALCGVFPFFINQLLTLSVLRTYISIN